jgi:osmotically-inducible protein OsmY
MRNPKRLTSMTAALVCTGGLAACAEFRTCGSDACADDAKITAAVEAAFDRHPELEPPNTIDVQTIDRVVYLNGLVDSSLEIAMADSVARQTPGVTRVVDMLAMNNS